ncbi:MAG: alpha/beta hydrolase [Lactobacillus sp.]|nr:alpha/beta hydrolase [Lactobacillus sp.]MDN6052567.1 alpha/beta hydrolase [Lactobacillus sp.]
MKHPIRWGIIALVLIASSTAGLYLTHLQAPAPASKVHTKIGTPTLFLHGYGSSTQAESYLVTRAINAGVTQNVITADVADHGQVTLQGQLPAKSRHPIVKINLRDNRNTNYDQGGRYLTSVVRALQAHYQFNQFNLVAHSMGTMAAVHYLLASSKQPRLPRVTKYISLAGIYNGVGQFVPADPQLDAKTGKPHTMLATYRKLLPLRRKLPQPIKVLNIIGNLRHGSDGTVDNRSSLALKYLLQPRSQRYQLLIFTGKGAGHSALHENPKVAQTINRFLWLK